MTNCEDNHNNYLYTYCPECGIKLDKDNNLLDFINNDYNIYRTTPFLYIRNLDINIKNLFNKDLYLTRKNNEYIFVYIEYFVELYGIAEKDLKTLYSNDEDLMDFGKLNENHQVHNLTYSEDIFKQLIFKIKYPELSDIEYKLYPEIEEIFIKLHNNDLEIDVSVINDMIKKYNK